MKVIYILSFIIYINSCVSFNQTNQIAGKYSYEEKTKNNYRYICQIILKEDSTFDYSEDGHMIHLKSSGNWKLVDNSLILTSYKQHGIKTVLEDNLNTDSIHVRVITIDSIPLAGSVVIINDDTIRSNLSNAAILNKDGFAHFSKQQVRQITVSLIDKYIYHTKNFNTDSFVISVVLSESAYQYFDSTKWEIKQNRLYRDKEIVLNKIE